MNIQGIDPDAATTVARNAFAAVGEDDAPEVVAAGCAITATILWQLAERPIHELLDFIGGIWALAEDEEQSDAQG